MAFSYSIFSRNDTLEPLVSADCQYLGGGQFSRSAPLSSVGSAVLNAIPLIVAWRVPSKIGKMVIGCVSIVMASFHTNRAWPQESSHYKSVNLEKSVFVLPPKKQVKSLIPFVGGRFFDFPSLYGTHLTKIRNLINSFIPNNRKPFLCHSIPQRGDMGSLA